MAVGKNVKGITIEFNGDTTKLGKAINDVDKKTKSLDKDIRAVDKALKFNPGNTELLAQKQQLLGQKVDETKKRLEALKTAQAQLDDDPAVDKTSQDYMELRREIITTESKLKHFNAELQKAKYANITRMGEAFQTAGQKMRTAGMYASGAAAAFIIAGKKLLDLNATQQAAETKLTEIYKSRMGATEAAAQSTIKLAGELQKVGVVGDEVSISAAQQLATYAKMPATVNTLLPALDNLLVQQKGVNATAEDATNLANLFGKAMMGQTGALKRAGISFTAAQEEVLKYGTEEEKAAMLAQVVTDNVGEMNKTFAETDAGKMALASNLLGDVGERLGALLLPVLAKIAEYLSDKVMPVVEKIVTYMEGHPVIAKVAVAITGLLAVGGPLLIFFGAMASAIGSLMTLIPTIATALPALGGAFAALSGPIGIAIAAIAALIAIGVLLYKHWDQVKEFLTKCWDGIKAACVAVFDGIKAYFQTVFTIYKTLFTAAFNAIKNIASATFEAIKKVITAPIEGALKIIKAIIEKIKALFNFKVSLPKIKLPHFSIKPKGWQLGDLLKGKIPTLGIDWYAQGGIFASPSVIGVGEAGPEAVLPIEKLQGMLAQMADNIVNGMLTGMQLQGAGSGGEITIPIYLYPSGPKMGEETVKMYDQYKRILG